MTFGVGRDTCRILEGTGFGTGARDQARLLGDEILFAGFGGFVETSTTQLPGSVTQMWCSLPIATP